MTYYIIHSGEVPLRDNMMFAGTIDQFEDCFGDQDMNNFAQEHECRVTEQSHPFMSDEMDNFPRDDLADLIADMISDRGFDFSGRCGDIGVVIDAIAHLGLLAGRLRGSNLFTEDDDV